RGLGFFEKFGFVVFLPKQEVRDGRVGIQFDSLFQHIERLVEQLAADGFVRFLKVRLFDIKAAEIHERSLGLCIQLMTALEFTLSFWITLQSLENDAKVVVSVKKIRSNLNCFLQEFYRAFKPSFLL